MESDIYISEKLSYFSKWDIEFQSVSMVEFRITSQSFGEEVEGLPLGRTSV